MTQTISRPPELVAGPYLLDRLHVEVTNVCNFKCEFCPDAIMARPRGHMDYDLLQKILGEVAAHRLARIVTFHLMGEPLIYPHIFPAIEKAGELGVRLHLTTNGSTFALRPDHIAALVNTDLPKVTISLQTPDPETFIIRGAPPRLDPESYFEGITQYVRTALQAPGQTRIHIKFLDSTPHPFLVPHKPLHVVEGKEQMQRELQQWATRLLSGLPEAPSADWISQQIQGQKPGRWQTIALHPRLSLETFPLDSWGNGETAEILPAKIGYCNGASQQTGILYDGTVVPCCKDYEGHIPLGNVNEQSLRDVLGDRPACQLRQGFDRFQVTNPICQQCIGADSPQKLWFRQLGSIAYFKLYGPLMRRLHPGWGDV